MTPLTWVSVIVVALIATGLVGLWLVLRGAARIEELRDRERERSSL